MDAMKPSKRQLCRQGMKMPLNLTALPARGAGEKSVVSYQTYGSNDTRSMISESVR